MREEMHNPPILNVISGIKGLLSGGFIALSIFTEWDPVARIILFIIGFIVFVDAVMPVDRSIFAATSVFFFIIGGLVGFFTAVSGSGLAYLVILLIISVLIYLDKIRRMRDIGKK